MFTDNDKGNAERFPAPGALMDAAPFGLEGCCASLKMTMRASSMLTTIR
ncbi:hypothetical protein H7H69_08175 [Mycobacterium heckeshornense]|nr:hypothetical protein [Mycobacterium heckeshornense]MCV7034196.1 hypothetical protein [Mycobacterium heckeshornense]